MWTWVGMCLLDGNGILCYLITHQSRSKFKEFATAKTGLTVWFSAYRITGMNVMSSSPTSHTAEEFSFTLQFNANRYCATLHRCTHACQQNEETIQYLLPVWLHLPFYVCRKSINIRSLVRLVLPCFRSPKTCTTYGLSSSFVWPIKLTTKRQNIVRTC